jgi:lysylphosphatidylglycerol synthetase-like protein (DUF2156 family)
MPELHFTLGGVAEAMDPRVRVGIAVDAAGTVHGVTSWLPILDRSGHPRGWTLDLMRRRPGGFRPVIDFLIASACLAFQAEGAAVVSLSGAPLARSRGTVRTNPTQRLLDLLGAALEPCYRFRSLHAYKAKFHPRREPLHLLYRRPADLPRISIALLRAYLTQPHRPKPYRTMIGTQNTRIKIADTSATGTAPTAMATTQTPASVAIASTQTTSNVRF